jgi:aspartyl-tRNA(Asn)/glutamyl-tRNA(Gln) amidotransferase subunit A
MRANMPTLTLRRANRLLEAGVITSEQLCSYCHALAVAGEEIWQLNAFTHLIARDQLLDWARESDHRRRQTQHHGKQLSRFEGIPLSFKANMAVASMQLTAASQILGANDANTPAVGYDADVVRIMIQDGGGILMGITNMDEFGMGSLGTFGIGKTTRNPTSYLRRFRALQGSDIGDELWVKLINKSTNEILEMHHKAYKEETVYSAGGSSCGSATSVAHGSSLLSLGTDTGGSVRLPAAWCGVVGLKPSYGLLSRHGVVSYASSLDTIGILAPSVDCVASVLDVLAQRKGPSKDSTASYYQESASLSNLIDNAATDGKSMSGIKVGIPAAFCVEECPRTVQTSWTEAANFLRQQGASVEIISNETVSPDIVQKSLAAYYVVASAEASSNLSRYDGFRYGVSASTTIQSNSSNSGTMPLEQQYGATRIQGFGTEVTRRVLCGTSVLSSDRFHAHYEAAAKLRAVLTQQLNDALRKVDVLLFPTTLFSPCPLDTPPDTTEMLANDVMTVPASLAGLPAVSVPLPVVHHQDVAAVFRPSIQIVGSRLGEATILRVARTLEQMGQTATS